MLFEEQIAMTNQLEDQLWVMHGIQPCDTRICLAQREPS